MEGCCLVQISDFHIGKRVSDNCLLGHGGQGKPPFLPPPLLPVKNRRNTAGPFVISERCRMYVNRGLGHVSQVRCNVRPEVAVFRLIRA